jgi:hypothetical protein
MVTSNSMTPKCSPPNVVTWTSSLGKQSISIPATCTGRMAWLWADHGNLWPPGMVNRPMVCLGPVPIRLPCRPPPPPPNSLLQLTKHKNPYLQHLTSYNYIPVLTPFQDPTITNRKIVSVIRLLDTGQAATVLHSHCVASCGMFSPAGDCSVRCRPHSFHRLVFLHVYTSTCSWHPYWTFWPFMTGQYSSLKQ